MPSPIQVTDAAGNESSAGTTSNAHQCSGWSCTREPECPRHLQFIEGGTTDNLQLLNGVTDESSLTISRVQIGMRIIGCVANSRIERDLYIGFSKFTGSHGDLYVKADGTAYYVHDGGDPSGSTGTDTFTYEVSDGT